VAQLGLEIVLAGFGPNLDLLQLKGALLFLGLLLLLGLFIFIAPIIHDFANRGVCIGRHLYEVQASFAGSIERVLDRQNAQLISIGFNNANLPGANISINVDAVRSAAPSVISR
jgi:hypothetical protein